MKFRGRKIFHHPAGHWLALLTFCLKLLVPVGYMVEPAKAEGGFGRIVLCTGYGPIDVYMGSDGHLIPAPDPAKDKVPDHQKTKDAPCAFSAFGQALHLTQDAPLVARRVFDHEVSATPLVATIGQGLAAPPPPALGPPFFL